MTSRLQKRESGFTIIELLIVIVVIGILAGLVLNVFTGIQEQGRDAERKTDLEAVEGQLEAYAAKNGFYPSEANLADAAWVSANLQGLDPDALLDPVNAVPYTYAASPANCDNTAGNECTSYVLSATLEEDGSTETRTSNL